jgi:hypothetical protein
MRLTSNPRFKKNVTFVFLPNTTTARRYRIMDGMVALHRVRVLSVLETATRITNVLGILYAIREILVKRFHHVVEVK